MDLGFSMSINIVNQQDINKYLLDVAEGDKQIAFWLETALLKSLRKREESAQPLTEPAENAPAWLQNDWDICGLFSIHKFIPDAKLKEQVNHIKDYLVSARLNNAEFLKDVDNKNRPQKLLNLNLESAYHAADKYTKYLHSKLGKVIDDDENTKTVMEFDDGSRIVQLIKPEALTYEGKEMGHCVGDGAYNESFETGSHIYYSLRDRSNKPHVTFQVEVNGNKLLQCKGKGNKPPVERYMLCVKEFVEYKRFDLVEYIQYTGLIKIDGKNFTINDNDPEKHIGEYYSVNNLPENLSVTDNANFMHCTGLTSIEKNFFAACDVLFANCKGLTSISKNFSALVGVNFAHCTGLTSIGEDFFVAGDVSFAGCTGLTSIPENFSDALYLNLRGCTGLTSIPENFSIAGDIFIKGCTGLRLIPRSIKCDGIMYTDLGDFNSVDEAADAFEKHFNVPNPRVEAPIQKTPSRAMTV